MKMQGKVSPPKPHNNFITESKGNELTKLFDRKFKKSIVEIDQLPLGGFK
jgi:hypothetical protein